MLTQLEDLIGILFTKKGKDAIYDHAVGHMSQQEGMELLKYLAEHNTTKSGALLAAQGIFALVDTSEFHHPGEMAQLLLWISLVLLLGSALLLLVNMWGSIKPFRPHLASQRNRLLFEIILMRTVMFNVSLAVTFCSVVLLGYALLKMGPM
jgi:hypothetical protein